MASNYQYSIKVNEALERYGAKTSGSLARRVERLKRFTAVTNKKYADEMKIENARMMANQEREERVQRRIQQAYDEEKKTAPVFLKRNLRRNLDQEFLNVMDKREEALERNREAHQEVEIPMTPRHSYNLRSRQENGLNLLWQAIQNGYVNTNRG